MFSRHEIPFKKIIVFWITSYLESFFEIVRGPLESCALHHLQRNVFHVSLLHELKRPSTHSNFILNVLSGVQNKDVDSFESDKKPWNTEHVWFPISKYSRVWLAQLDDHCRRCSARRITWQESDNAIRIICSWKCWVYEETIFVAGIAGTID